MNTTQAQGHRFVLVAGLDESSQAGNVLANSVAIVRGRPNAELHLVHALDIGVESAMTPLLDTAREYLDRMGDRAANGCEARVTTHLGVSRPWREIVQTAANLEADLIVVGTHGRKGVSRLIVGSQAERVVRNAACPVLVVREKDYGTLEVPEIEAPCPECLKVQEETKGEKLWCAHHSERHPRPRRHYEFPESFGRGTMLIREP
jgi:nucleotide-binding universal stress UspA family protein